MSKTRDARTVFPDMLNDELCILNTRLFMNNDCGSAERRNKKEEKDMIHVCLSQTRKIPD